jgi:hypothetical protein
MSECPKCKRPVVTYAQFCESGATAWQCCGEDDLTCPVIVDAFNRGMREGMTIAKERAKADSWDSRYLVWERIPIDWSGADAELERRLNGGSDDRS